MREIKKAAIWILAVLALAFVLDRAGGFLCGELLYASRQRFSRLYRGAMEHGIVTFGNSRGVNAFPAAQIAGVSGQSAFNLSYNGMSARITEAMALDYLERNRLPELVIIEVSSVEMEDALVPELRPYAHLSMRLRDIIEPRTEKAATGMRISRLFAYNSELFLRALFYLSRNDQDWSNPRGISLAALRKEESRRGESVSVSPRPEQLEALGRLVSVLRAKGVEVRLMLAPYLPAYRARIADIGAFKSAVSNATGGLEVHDFSDAIDDSAFFADRLHLNTKGADLLVAMMKERGVLERR